MNITVVVLAKNVEKLLPACIESVRWAQDIVVIDTHSTDKTRELARRAGARVYTEEFKGYGALRKRALKYVQTDWVFYLDADERVQLGLQQEVQRVITQGIASAIALPRKNIMLGKWLKYGGWYPDYQTRIFLRKDLVGWRGTLHELPSFRGTKVFLHDTGLIHVTSQSIDAMLAKTFEWSKEEGKLLFEAHHPSMNASRFFSIILRAFVQRMITASAWRDGTTGVVLALYQVFSVFLTYARLWELQNRERITKAYKVLDRA